MFLTVLGDLNNDGDTTVSLWTILIILGIVALLIIIFRNLHR